MMYETLLKIAQRDLEAAKILYENKLYPQAVFYLQQSVEKAAKTFAIMAKIVSENEVKQVIGHNPLKIHKKILNRQKEELEQLGKVCEMFPGLTETELFKTIDINELRGRLDESQRSLNTVIIEKPIFLSKHEIMQFIEELNEFQSGMEEGRKNLDSFKFPEEWFDEVKEMFSEFLNIINPREAKKTLEELGTIDRGLFENAIKEALLPMLDLYYVHLSLFYLSVITFPHAVIARYPDDDFNPIKVYNRNFPLIKLFEECHKVMRSVLIKMGSIKKFIEETDKIESQKKVN